MARTEIIATLGPSTMETPVIQKMIEAGLDVARLNFSHGDHAQLKSIAANAKAAGIPLIMQDLQGPKIRLGKLPQPIEVQSGETLTFTSNEADEGIHVPYPALPQLVQPGHRILINDGLVQCEVTSCTENSVSVKVLQGGTLSSNKGLNIPDSKLPSEAKLSAKDLKDLAFGVQELEVDVVALSFVESAEDITHLREEIKKLTDREVKICAKIERPQALDNLDAIIQESDWVMVARGDLGIEIAPERVPVVQRQIIEKCQAAGKYVIIATQILQSMVENPLPTRAEISDAATAVFEHANAVMLSNETAVGKFPVEAVSMLEKVAQNCESAL